MKISVVVPAFNEEKLIARSLETMRRATSAFTAAGWASEIIVCDNNSTDRTTEIARAAGAVVIFEPVNQISRARNRGASAANGDWLVFVDADSYPTAELFTDLLNTIQTGDCVGGGSTIALDQPRGAARWIIKLWNFKSRMRRWAAGSFVFCRADIFRELGGFSHEFFITEEIYFSQRLKRRARELGKSVVILHQHPLLTSARKVDLYSTGEHLRFILLMITRLGRPIRDRSACGIWYDGRR